MFFCLFVCFIQGSAVQKRRRTRAYFLLSGWAKTRAHVWQISALVLLKHSPWSRDDSALVTGLSSSWVADCSAYTEMCRTDIVQRPSLSPFVVHWVTHCNKDCIIIFVCWLIIKGEIKTVYQTDLWLYCSLSITMTLVYAVILALSNCFIENSLFFFFKSWLSNTHQYNSLLCRSCWFAWHSLLSPLVRGMYNKLALRSLCNIYHRSPSPASAHKVGG